MKKKVYLDHNIIILAESNNILFNYLCSIKKHYTYYYSPAHIEEIFKKYKSMINKKENFRDCKFSDGNFKKNLTLYLLLCGYDMNINIDYIVSLMKCIELLTDNKDIIPYFSSRDKINRITLESTLECFGRVCNPDTTDQINASGKKIYNDALVIREKRKSDKTITNIPNLNEKDIWENHYIEDALNLFNSDKIYNYIPSSNICDCQINLSSKNKVLGIRNDFTIRKFLCKEKKCSRREIELTFEILFQILNANGYCREKDESKSVSSIHDVSHAIYGSYCDIFITADKNFFKKLKAVYYYLGIEKEVYFCPQKNAYKTICNILK